MLVMFKKNAKLWLILCSAYSLFIIKSDLKAQFEGSKSKIYHWANISKKFLLGILPVLN